MLLVKNVQSVCLCTAVGIFLLVAISTYVIEFGSVNTGNNVAAE
jgi:hypothetical protein